MTSYPEPLEQAFQQAEAESERRAKLEEESPLAAPKQRRRASISVSKLGELAPGGRFSLAHDCSAVEHSTSKADFYQSQLSCSTDSFTTARLGEDAKVEEETGVFQVEYIPQPTTISTAVRKLLPRTPSRAQFATIESSIQESSCIVIGVSVEEAAEDDQPHTGAVAYGSGGHKLRDLNSSLPGRLVRRAKRVFCRRSAGLHTTTGSS